MGALGLCALGFLTSFAVFISSIIEYKTNIIHTKKPIIISGILSFVLSIPILLMLVFLIDLAIGFRGM